MLITSDLPSKWIDLEALVAGMLNEAGLVARRNVTLTIPRGSIDVDVVAEDTHDGIVHVIVCECKNWAKNVPKEVVNAFRTVMQECGAHRGYLISRAGFQSGAHEAAHSTNIQLVTIEEFQEIYFEKWYVKRLWAIERNIKGFHTYYEMVFGKPGYSELKNDQERAAYDAVWRRNQFDPSRIEELEEAGVIFPEEIKTTTGYREFFALLEGYALNGLRELRALNPLTRSDPENENRA